MDKRTLILDAATQSFSQFGYKATSVEQVAKIANVGKGTIYNFFKNKEEILSTLVDQFIQEMKYAAQESIVDDEPFFINAHRSLHRFFKFQKEHDLIIKLLQELKEVGTPEVRVMVNRIDDSVLLFLGNKLKRAIERGEIIDCNIELTAFLLYKMYVALALDWEKNHKALNEEELANYFHLYFFKGLSK